MEENKEMSSEIKEKVTQKVVDKLSLNYKITNDTTSVIARTEALNIVVGIINAFLSERQKGENKLSDVELGAIQAAVVAEDKKTVEIYKAIDALINKQQV